MSGTVGRNREARAADLVRRRCIVVAASIALAACADYVAPGYYGPDDTDSGTDTSSAGVTPEGSDDASTSVVTPAGDGGVVMSAKPTGPCDLTGRWVVTVRTVTDALGTSQAAHEWYYFDISQTGTKVTVSKGLACGENVRALSSASGNADFPKTWPGMMANLVITGRTGTSASASGGCQVSFDAVWEAMSATESYYTDPSHPLPDAGDQASGSTPGWQDWDQDGNPGYTLSVTGLATGQIYMVARTKFAYSGSIAASASSFDLLVDWTTEQDVLGVNGPPILSMTTAAVKDSDPSQHFASFARLSDSQATGDDASVCSAIRTLAPMLETKANN
jgi:hypothetical protein